MRARRRMAWVTGGVGVVVAFVLSACQPLPNGWTYVQGDLAGNPAVTFVGRAAAPGNLAATIPVTGSIASMVADGPSTLTPAFSPSISDYTVRCQATGGTSVTLELHPSSGSLGFDGLQATILRVSIGGVMPDQAVEVTDGSAQYWVRCLPADFPVIHVTSTGGATPGWYLYGNITNDTGVASGAEDYAMILDGNGTPVWYQGVLGGPTNVESIAPGVIDWAAGGPQSPTTPVNDTIENVATGSAQHLTAPVGITDSHDMLRDASGNIWMLVDRVIQGVDLTALGKGTNQTTLDCGAEEVSPQGTLLWSWWASQHVAPSESQLALYDAQTFGGQTMADIYHCNSIDLSPDGTQLLLSMRNTASVYDISVATGKIQWKVGGSATGMDGEQVLKIIGDPEGTISGQHDARFEPDNQISVFDDHSSTASGAARGIEYAIDTTAGTATMTWEYADPDGKSSGATGSTRRYADGDSVICWGFHTDSGYTEVNASNTPVLEVTFPDGAMGFRAVKYPTAQFDATTLRNSVWQDNNLAS